jgi:predicted Zn-dependent protease
VLGHEIGHVTARHSVRQYTRTVGGTLLLGGLGVFVPAARPFGQISEQALGLLFLKYGRDDELQADGLGARYEASGGWDPEGIPGMLSTLGRLDEAAGDRKGVPNWLSTHPEPLLRVKEIQPAVQQLKSGRTNFVTDRETLLQRIDGLILGDNPSQGITRGSTFLHPPLRFRIEFPSGWEVANSPRQVVAKAPDADVFMLLQLVSKPQGPTAPEVAAAACAAPVSGSSKASGPPSTGSRRMWVSTRARSKGSERWSAAPRTSVTTTRTTWCPVLSHQTCSVRSTRHFSVPSDRSGRCRLPRRQLFDRSD